MFFSPWALFLCCRENFLLFSHPHSYSFFTVNSFLIFAPFIIYFLTHKTFSFPLVKSSILYKFTNFIHKKEASHKLNFVHAIAPLLSFPFIYLSWLDTNHFTINLKPKFFFRTIFNSFFCKFCHLHCL